MNKAELIEIAAKAADISKAAAAKALDGAMAAIVKAVSKGDNFKVGHRTIEDLAEQIGRLRARQRPGAFLATADFLDVLRNRHGRIVPDQ